MKDLIKFVTNQVFIPKERKLDNRFRWRKRYYALNALGKTANNITE